MLYRIVKIVSTTGIVVMLVRSDLPDSNNTHYSHFLFEICLG